MKGLSELLIIVVTVIVILIAALVLVTIFGKGTGGIQDTAFKVRATAQCEFRCAALCPKVNPTAGPPQLWASEEVREGELRALCSTIVNCDCKQRAIDAGGVFTPTPPAPAST